MTKKLAALKRHKIEFVDVFCEKGNDKKFYNN